MRTETNFVWIALTAVVLTPGTIDAQTFPSEDPRRNSPSTYLSSPEFLSGQSESSSLTTWDTDPLAVSTAGEEDSDHVAPATEDTQTSRPGMGGPGMGGPGMGGPGMGGPGMGGPGMGGPSMGGPAYSAVWYPSSRISGPSSGDDFGTLRQNLSISAPVWSGNGNFITLSTSLENSLFFTDAVLPDSGREFPEELWNVSLGVNYMHEFDNGWLGMFGVNLGSASDKPFFSIDEMNIGFMSFLQVPARNERDRWSLMLMYSPVGNLTFPIPGVAYLWNPCDSFQASVGLPCSVTWRPTEKLTVSASYMPLLTVNGRATYTLTEKLSVYCGFESQQAAYLLAGRDDADDRFIGFEKRLVGGMQWNVCRYAAVELSAGYAFDRYFGVGQNQIGDDLDDRIDLGHGAFLSTSFQLRF